MTAKRITALDLKAALVAGGELALLDVREERAFSEAHLLYAVSAPLSRLELVLADLVPRTGAPVVLCDAGDGLSERAAARMAELGYSDISVLDRGILGWREAGFEIFSGVSVPSKAFGEFVEETYHTPSLSAAELKAKLDAGADLVILDSRPFDEYRRMSIPGGIDCPGAELVYRAADLAPSPDTTVVVNCAGRTRSIIGAQSLINAGIPNKVIALRNGTMGWELAGFDCARGQGVRAIGPVPDAARAVAQGYAKRVAERFGVRTIDVATLRGWQAEAERRTLYLLDVRYPEEYVEGHVAGSVSAPGGQLVQATDQYVGVRGARLVLIDNDRVRATMTASWLIQMGWEAVVLRGGLETLPIERGTPPRRILGLDRARPQRIDAAPLKALLDGGTATLIDIGTSRAYRAGHIPGAWFAVRSRLDAALTKIPANGALVLTSEDGALAQLAAAEIGATALSGGTAAWAAAYPLAAGPGRFADEPDDVWLKPYERNVTPDQARAAMNEYLTWEVNLVQQIARDGTARFRKFPV
jgi:rhodanese-related sulfurtransferase